MSNLALALLLFLPPPTVGGITFYAGKYEGRNLACPGYRYEEATGPWLAVDVSWYQDGRARCGSRTGAPCAPVRWTAATWPTTGCGIPACHSLPTCRNTGGTGG